MPGAPASRSAGVGGSARGLYALPLWPAPSVSPLRGLPPPPPSAEEEIPPQPFWCHSCESRNPGVAGAVFAAPGFRLTRFARVRNDTPRVCDLDRTSVRCPGCCSSSPRRGSGARSDTPWVVLCLSCDRRCAHDRAPMIDRLSRPERRGVLELTKQFPARGLSSLFLCRFSRVEGVSCLPRALRFSSPEAMRLDTLRLAPAYGRSNAPSRQKR